MFIKKTKVRDKEYIQITKTIRTGKKVKHKVFLNLGRREKINFKDIEDLINTLQKFLLEAKPNEK
jgi:hypothetical protein